MGDALMRADMYWLSLILMLLLVGFTVKYALRWCERALNTFTLRQHTTYPLPSHLRERMARAALHARARWG